MKLFAYQPRGHGLPSYFVMAKDREMADALVGQHSKGEINYKAQEANGTYVRNYYEITEHDVNDIVVNDNG